MQHLRTGPLRAAVAGVGASLLLALTAGCSGGDDTPGEAAASSLPGRSVGTRPTLDAKPVPMRVTVARVVGGKLSKQQRSRLDRNLTRVLSDYFDAAFIGGDYPRKDFPGAFARFSGGAARQARGDKALLTNAAIGAETEAVVPRVKSARLDVLAPRRHVAGLTARIRVVFVQERTDGNDQRVTVSGRLLMARKKSGPWQVFGYDVTRSSVAAAKGAR